MQAVLLGMLSAAGKVLLSMLTALFTEKFLKTAIIAGLEKLSAKTQNDLDDKLLAAAKEAWGYVPAEEKSNDDGK
jgi:hypothetical protein